MTVKYMIIDNFDNPNIENYMLNHVFVKSYNIELEKNTLKIHFDYSGWEAGNGALYVSFKQKMETYRMPKKFSMKVYAEGKVPWLRANFIDGEGQRRIVNLTESTLSWHGWKYIDVEIDHTWPLPIYLERMYPVEVDKTYRQDETYGGTIKFTNLQFVFIDDVDKKGPYFIDDYEKRTKINDTVINEHIRIIDEMSGVNHQSIEVKLNGEKIEYNYADGLVHVYHDVKESGSYLLEISAKDRVGNIAVPHFKKNIIVDLTKDTKAPTISSLSPVLNEKIYTSRPRITFHIEDDLSGVLEEDVQVVINGEDAEVFYDEYSGWGYALPKVDLQSGKYRYQIICCDRAGNFAQSDDVVFFIEKLYDKDCCNKLIVIPDTHDAEYLQLALKTIENNSSALVLHMGDIVDGATKEEYLAAKRVLQRYPNKYYLHMPGNHETFLGNLEFYRTHFGSPTYHVELEDILIIILNSAYEQSISESDNSQFHYVKTLLNIYQPEKTIIATHVPFRDHLGTEHQMDEDDVKKLKDIFKSYKISHPKAQFTFLFGHLHVTYEWEDEIGQYYMTGNNSYKGYVDESKGNLLGYSQLDFHKDKIEYRYIPYINNISIYINNQLYHTEMKYKKGDMKKLTVIGHINELHTKYDVDIERYETISKSIHVKDEEIVTLDKENYLYFNKQGSTELIIEVGNIICAINIIVE